jgi:hypothetical protein
MIGHSGAPLEHLVHPAVCKTVRMIAQPLHVLKPTFFANGAAVGGVRERALGSPTHPQAHRGAWRRKTGRGSSAPPLCLDCLLRLLFGSWQLAVVGRGTGSD